LANANNEFDAVIVGAGFAGMYMLHRLRGLGFSAKVIEAGDGVGGTWYWNRYPGARCDVESLDYQYSFSNELQKDWNWTERYATQPEILTYANHVAERFDLMRDIQFETRVTAAHYNDAAERWTVETDKGDRYTAQFCIMATGCLSAARTPDFKGIESFTGATYHTGQWPHEGVDFAGKRVGIIGTGSSAIQSIPVIAQQAAHLTVFQRTPNFSLPANAISLSPDKVKHYKENFDEIKAAARLSAGGVVVLVNEASALSTTAEERDRVFEETWKQGGFQLLQSYIDLLATKEANETAADFIRRQIRSVVSDPATAELLCPKDHPVGTKRICIDSNYFETYNRDNVKLVDIRNAPIEEITPNGLKTGGKEYEFDIIVFATGFDAMTGTLLRMDIQGKQGASLREKWAAGPRTYLGLQSEGFPNMFMITGPGSPSVLSNMLISIEQHVDWIADCMTDLRAQGKATIEANRDAEDAWVEHVNQVADTTLYPLANSWYLGANIPGKPRVFMPYVGGVGPYRERCKEVRAKGYEGFTVGGKVAVTA
jgi:cyclohexanone monooxygenase